MSTLHSIATILKLENRPYIFISELWDVEFIGRIGQTTK
jgi:hypothetical protein